MKATATVLVSSRANQRNALQTRSVRRILPTRVSAHRASFHSATMRRITRREHFPALFELSEAAKKGTSLAVETEPGVGLRSGLRWAQVWRRKDCFLFSGRIVFGFDQRGAVSLAFDLEDDRFFDEAVEKSHRQRAINQILSPFVEVHIGHQRGGALLTA